MRDLREEASWSNLVCGLADLLPGDEKRDGRTRQAIASACDRVAETFGGDLDKTALWFRVRNPLLGDVSPRDMIRSGRLDRLVRFIFE